MSTPVSEALRRAEAFLEEVDESVAQALRRLVVKGATGSVDEQEDPPSEEEDSQATRASAIPGVEHRAGVSVDEAASEDLDGQIGTGWTDDMVVDEAMFKPMERAEADDKAVEEEKEVVEGEDNSVKGIVAAEHGMPVAPEGSVSNMEESRTELQSSSK